MVSWEFSSSGEIRLLWWIKDMGCGGRQTHFTDKDQRDSKTKVLVEGHAG